MHLHVTVMRDYLGTDYFGTKHRMEGGARKHPHMQPGLLAFTPFIDYASSNPLRTTRDSFVC
jgi:hypothetical protein